MDFASDRIKAIQYILATIFTSQNALKTLAPEFKWSGLGNLLGDFGELVATDYYQLNLAPRSSDGYDAVTQSGEKVQIKTNYASSQIGFRGEADLMLVIKVMKNGNWEEIYFGDFGLVKQNSRYSARDNKYMIAITKLCKLKEQSV